MKNFFNEFIFGNYFIALCALAMIFSTDLLNQLPLSFTPATIFVTAATYLLYNFHRHSFHIDYANWNTIIATIRNINLKTSEKISYAIAIIAIIVYFFRLHENVYPFLIPLAILAIAYSVPLLKSKGRKVRLKEVFFIKTPVIALVWSLTTTVIPLVEQNISLQSSFVFWQIVSKTLFIFVLCIPFEMRDMEIDRKNNVSTLAVAHGRKSALVIGVIIIMIEMFTHHLMKGVPGNIIFALDLSSVAALIILLFQNSRRSPYYYKFFVDGTMVLRFMILLLLTRAL